MPTISIPQAKREAAGRVIKHETAMIALIARRLGVAITAMSDAKLNGGDVTKWQATIDECETTIQQKQEIIDRMLSLMIAAE